MDNIVQYRYTFTCVHINIHMHMDMYTCDACYLHACYPDRFVSLRISQGDPGFPMGSHRIPGVSWMPAGDPSSSSGTPQGSP